MIVRLGQGVTMKKSKFSVSLHVVSMMRALCLRVGLEIVEIEHMNPIGTYFLIEKSGTGTLRADRVLTEPLIRPGS